MGRRKSTTKKITKKRDMTVPKVFKCIFCNHEEAVECRMDFRVMIGDLKCNMCGEGFQTTIHSLSDPIDVFSEWLDETQELQLQADGGR
jgi:transcription elongation factor Elf1